MNDKLKNFIKLYLVVEQYSKSVETIEECFSIVENDWGSVVVEFKGDTTLNQMNTVFNKIYNLINMLNFEVDEYNNQLGTIILTVNGIDESEYYYDGRLTELELSN